MVICVKEQLELVIANILSLNSESLNITIEKGNEDDFIIRLYKDKEDANCNCRLVLLMLLESLYDKFGSLLNIKMHTSNSDSAITIIFIP